MAIFDTLRAAQRLRDEADQPPAAAETIAAVIGEAVTPGRDDVMGLREDVGALRGELHHEVASLRTELHDGLAGLRGELHDEVGALREEMAALRGELREGLQSMRTEMQAMRAEMYAIQLRAAGFTIALVAVAVAVVKFT